MSTTGRRFTVTVPDWGQGHLSSEAVAAFVDGELADGPRTRAARHLAVCRECAAQVGGQVQARTALRSAGVPVLPSSLLMTLQSIPQVAELPPPPHGLAVTADGQLVSVLRTLPPPAGLTARHPADSARRVAQRRVRVGAGVAVTGLTLLALGATGLPSDSPVPATSVDPGVFGGAPVVAAHLQLPLTTVDQPARFQPRP